MAESTQQKRVRGRAKAKSDTGSSVTQLSSTPKRKASVALPLDMKVCCVSSIPVGPLVYTSRRMQGMIIEWDEFGSEQYIELAELQSMRNSSPAFFENNWILIDDEEVLHFLHADKYYGSVKSIDDLYGILKKHPNNIAQLVKTLPDHLKKTLSIVAYREYTAGRIDSIGVIKAVERATDLSILSN